MGVYVDSHGGHIVGVAATVYRHLKVMLRFLLARSPILKDILEGGGR